MPTISDMVCFEDTKGTIMEVFKRPEFTHRKFQTKGIIPHKLGHVAFHVADVKKATQFYCFRQHFAARISSPMPLP